MATLNVHMKAPIIDQDGVQVTRADTVTSSNPAVCAIAVGDSDGLFAVGNLSGTSVISAYRVADGSLATLDVEVVGLPFAISLGAEVPA